MFDALPLRVLHGDVGQNYSEQLAAELAAAAAEFSENDSDEDHLRSMGSLAARCSTTVAYTGVV